jgi:hypothetical protein
MILLAWLCLFEAKGQGKILQQQYYGIENGLPHREVNAVCESSDGFIWNPATQTRELLESGKVLVKQAAAQVGFKDIKHFTGLYKIRFGKLPSEA